MAKDKESLNPQQIAFLEAYLNIDADTFGNAVQSALKAKYSEDYANNITAVMPQWLLENVGDAKMLLKAERNLNRAMDIDLEDEKIGDRNLKASMFVAKGLGKAKYSERTELTGPNGRDLIPVEEVKKRIENLKKI